MANIEPIVKVDITLQTSTQTRQGFGTLLFATADRRFPSTVKTYGSLTSVAEDFATTDQAYLAARSYFSQNPRPTSIKIGQLEADIIFAPLAATAIGDKRSFTFIDDTGVETLIEFTSVTGAETSDDIVDDLIVKLTQAGIIGNGNPLDDKVDATDNGGTLTLSEKNSLPFGTAPEVVDIVRSVTLASGETGTTAVAKFAAADDDWYFYAADQKDTAFIEATAAAIEPLLKMYFYSTSANECLDAYVPTALAVDDVMGALDDKNYNRSIGIFHDLDSGYAETAYVGVNAPYDAGSVVWANLTLAGIPAPKNPLTGKPLTETERQNIADRNGNVQVPKGNALVVRLGKVASGEAISTIRGADALNDAITVAVCNILLGSKGSRIVFDDKDISIFGAAISTVLNEFVARKFILPDFTVTLPRAADIPASEKATGTLSGLEFNARLAAAILSAEVQGTISI